MKDIKCKCSHLKSEHSKGLCSDCKNCACNSYLKHTDPNKLDKVAMYYGIGMIAMCVLLVPLLSTTGYDYSPYENDEGNIEMSKEVFMNKMVLPFFAIIATFASYLLLMNLILPYFADKTRKDLNNQ